MRQILSLSLPQKDSKDIKSLSRQRGFNSLSGYIKYLIDLDRELISEKKLLKSINEARKEYKSGKTIKAKSMSELL
jgi:Arc/MetJ-type ribon-helix-helix transcriptional regulator